MIGRVPEDTIWEQLTRPLPPGWVIVYDGESFLVEGPGADNVGRSESDNCAVLFFGLLHGSGSPPDFIPTPILPEAAATAVREGYEQQGVGVLGGLAGRFAVLIWDKARRQLLAARDPIGMVPLFHSHQGARWLFSPSIPDLRRRPEVTASINRTSLANFITFNFLSDDATFFDGILRVPVGQALLMDSKGSSTFRYWRPLEGETPNWAAEDEIAQFDHLMSQAVGRVMAEGASALYLSGGLDSVSVAAYAAQIAELGNLPLPLGLSLVFDHPGANEEAVQRSVASQLGMNHIVEPLDRVVAPLTLAEAMAVLSGSASAPLSNFWRPAYLPLAVQAGRRGYRTVMNGSGGDEWLTVSPYLAADLMLRGNVRGLVHLLGTYYRSSLVPRVPLTRMVLWHYGARPLIGEIGAATLQRIAPGRLRRRRLDHWHRKWPAWLAPDPDLRTELAAQVECYVDTKLSQPRAESHYTADGRNGLEHPLVTLDREEEYEYSLRSGLPIRSPYWDSSLVGFLFRVHPKHLNQNMRTKGLVREAMASRFPDLGFERQKKVSATGYFQDIVGPDLMRVWHEASGASALAVAGVIDPDKLAHLITPGTDGKTPLIPLWQLTHLLTCESWLRHNLV